MNNRTRLKLFNVAVKPPPLVTVAGKAGNAKGAPNWPHWIESLAPNCPGVVTSVTDALLMTGKNVNSVNKQVATAFRFMAPTVTGLPNLRNGRSIF
jgi:hypothetical protein